MPSAGYDLGYLQAGIDELETYLLSKELFWPLLAGSPVGEPPYPRLTLGGLLLALERSRARVLPPSQNEKIRSLESKLEHTRSRWRAAWGRKAKREFLSRLRQWGNYLNDLRRDQNEQVAYYANEVRLRVMMDLLTPDMDFPEAAYFDLLNGLDSLLQTILVPGDFIWEKELSAGFSKDSYWYLWGLPKKSDSLHPLS